MQPVQRRTRPREVALVIPVPRRSHTARSRFAHLADASPLAHCLDAMLDPTRTFAQVLVVTAEADRADARAVLAAHGHDDIALITAEDPGTRAECLRTAVGRLAEDVTAVLIHDLSRPLVSSEVRDRVLDALADGHGLVVPTLAMVDSVKAVDADGAVVSTIDRTTLRSAQFPRGVDAEVLRAGLAIADVGESTFDEIDAAVSQGAQIVTVDGDPDGFPVGDRDVLLAEAILSCRLEGRR